MRKGDYKIMARLVANNAELPHIHNLYDGNEGFVKSAKLTDFVLFNLKNDISESEDLSKQKLEIFEEMKMEFEAQYKKLLNESHIWSRKE